MTQTIYRINLTLLLLIALLSGNASASLDVSLKSIDDSQHKLSEYIGKGKWVVLSIWGTRCPPCREEMPELVRFHDEHKDKDAIVVGIAIDFPSYGYAKQDEVISFAEDYLIDFPILLSDSSITQKIGLGRLEGLPTTYLFNPNGDVVGMQVGSITSKILENFIKKNNAVIPDSK
ncbi:MAG: redoxin domain-containing protein [Gammaproteobacteria bacterium]|nr:redoxin domain-containing protein [Gammaproteobacteria bacterium]